MPDLTIEELLVRNVSLEKEMDSLRTMLNNVAEQRDGFRAQMEALSIEALREDDRAFAVAGRIEDDGSWFFDLLKRRFHIDRVDGAVTELKLRCDRDYVLFRYRPDLEYEVADRVGDCLLEVVGEPGTGFRLVQS